MWSSVTVTQLARVLWLLQVPDLVQMVLVEFDYLVTKDKIEDGENFKDFLNPVVSIRSTSARRKHIHGNYGQRFRIVCSTRKSPVNSEAVSQRFSRRFLPTLT